jgi:two-component system sensor histidine kinase KdpD
MTRDDPVELWIAIGGVGAIALGVALIPLRPLTVASNLAFVFLAFTIVVAEFGGRIAALVTAIVSAMSLNFFLTEPYLTLTISKSEDVVAFFALAGCGLLAAAFGARRVRWARTARRTRKDLGVLEGVVDQLKAGAPLEAVLSEVGRGFGLRRLVLRDASGRVLAEVPAGGPPTEAAEALLAPDSLLASGAATTHRLGARGFRLPEGGGRIRLQDGDRRATLDLWEGDPEGLDLDERRALFIAASILGLALAVRQPAP